VESSVAMPRARRTRRGDRGGGTCAVVAGYQQQWWHWVVWQVTCSDAGMAGMEAGMTFFCSGTMPIKSSSRSSRQQLMGEWQLKWQ
jgi:hypothetical protein